MKFMHVFLLARERPKQTQSESHCFKTILVIAITDSNDVITFEMQTLHS